MWPRFWTSSRISRLRPISDEKTGWTVLLQPVFSFRGSQRAPGLEKAVAVFPEIWYICGLAASARPERKEKNMDKLKELTDKLYSEGLSKGKEEGERLLQKAREEADGLLAQARAQAQELLSKSQGEAQALRTKTENDLKMASAQALQATKNELENLIVSKMSDLSVGKALSEPDFVRGLLREVARNFSSEGPKDLELVLPEALRAETEPFVKGELAKLLGAGIEASFSKKIAGGFNIGPKEGGWFISLSDETFKSLVREYLRPATRKLLFGE